MRFKYLIAVPAIFLAAACKDNDAKVDDALNSDLSLAAQSPVAPMDSISGVERGYTTGAAVAAAPVARTATRRTTSAPVRRTSTARRTASSGSSSSGGTYYPPAPATKVVKHTKRDAAIGAAA